MRNALRNTTLVMVSCLVTLVFGEAILRFAAHRLLRGGEWLAAGQIFKIIDPPVGFSLQPGATQILVTGKAYTSRATINSNPSSTNRIVALSNGTNSEMHFKRVSSTESIAKS